MSQNSRLAGFTLIELIMVITIMGVVSVVMGRLLTESFKTFITAQNISEVDWQGLLATNNFTNDVHSIRSANDISAITASSFSFIDTSGATNTYQLSGSNLLLNSATLATGASNLAFAYYDKNYLVTATAANVRYITFSIKLTQNNLSQTYTTMAGTRGMP